MNLYETVQALEVRNITIALDLGAHQYCALDSNCPLAVQLRKLIGNAGITLEELLRGFQEVTAPDPINWARIIPQVDATLNMQLMGQTIHINLTEEAASELAVAVRHKTDSLDRSIVDIRTIGRGLYSRYKQEIQRQREVATLPQLAFGIRELVSANCMVTVRDRKYNIIFPFKYRPDGIVRGGTRYQLSDEHMQAIRRDVFIKYIIRQNYSLLRADVIKADGSKFEHYHGNDEHDCWGHVTLLPRWDGRLSSLVSLTRSLSGALATINRDSVLERHPHDMPHADVLLENSTHSGEGGVPHRTAGGTRAIPRQEPVTEADAATPRRGWGRRTRETQGGQPAVTPLEEEMVRRFSVTNSDNMELICALCGEPLGRHYGERAEVCPRDHNRVLTAEDERMRRFNITNPPTDMESICNLCGERAGEHYGDGTECPRDHRFGGR